MLEGPDPVTERALGRIGQVLRGKWTIEALIGIGGMAGVFAATHRNGKRVAVKMLHTELSIDSGIRSRFLREGYVANKVAHPGAVSVIDDDTAEDGSVYLVMDLLEGETLASRAVRCGGKLDAGDVLSMADQLLDVLAAAHDKGIIHRDIKPENVFVTREGQVKVLDFGIARVKELSTASTATKAGSTMGTPAYMPPEQARGRWEELDGRSDLWAVGATMYTLLTGKPVHEARTVNELLLAAMTKSVASIATVVQGLPAQVIELIDKALAFDKSDRWADARTMQDALRIAYQACIGNPISTAPRLSVPEMATASTLSSSPGVQSVQSCRADGDQGSGEGGERDSRARSSRVPVVVAITVTTLIAVVGLTLTIKFTGGTAQAPGSGAAVSVASEARTAASIAPPADPQPSAVPVDQLPTVRAAASAPRPEGVPGRKSGAPASAQPHGTNTQLAPAEPDMDKRR